MMKMKFEWDPAKAASNLRKHKIPFRRASEVFMDDLRREHLDDSCDYGEERHTVLGCADGAVLFVVYT